MLFAIALLAGALSLQQGDITVRSELSAHGTSVGQPVVYTVTVRTKSAEDPLIEIPSLPAGLQIVGTSSSTQVEISMPGGRTSVVRQDYQIVATRAGAYTILPAAVQIGGRTYRTERQDLSVGPGTAQRTSEDSPIKLRASIEPKLPYVGQQLLLKIDAMIPVDARYQPLRPPSYDPPAPSGFWIQNLPDPISADVQTIGGVSYDVQTFQRAYFPITAGQFTIPPARLIYDMRGGVFFAPETREVLSDSLTVEVRPLPAMGKPSTFTGAVGEFEVARGVDKSTAGVGDAITYTMMVDGTGNVKALPPPAFPRLDNADVYPPSEDARLRIVNGVVGGSRTFAWVIIPRRPGTLEIPAVQYSWFNPKTERYDSASVNPIRITVTPAVSIATAGGDTVLAPMSQRPASRLATFARTRAFLALQLIPLALLALILFLRRRSGSAGAQERARRNELTMRLVVLETLARNDPRGFYGEAIAIVGEARGMAPSLAERTDALVERLRAARYAPEVPPLDARLADLAEVRALVDSAFAKTETRTRTRGGRTPVIIIAVTAGAIFGHAREAGAGTRGYSVPRAVQLYEQHDYRAAARELSAVVSANPSNATAWYDLGNAYYRSDDPGRAAWAWLHALQLEPRNGDVAHNLTIVNARRATVAVQTWFPISSAELAWLAAICWWLCMAAAIAHVLRPRTATRVGGLLFATACATALIMIAARWVGPDAVVPAGHGASLYSAPTTRTDVRDRLEVGDAAQILRRQEDWLLVRTSSFQEGWVPVSAVLTL
jgi:hypothetical protein